MPAPSYSSLDDIKDELSTLDFGSNTNLTDARLRRIRQKIRGEIDAALVTGGYTVPVTNDVTDTVNGALTASTTKKTITLTTGSSDLAKGKHARIYGFSTNTFNDEFVEIVGVTGTTQVDVPSLESAYDDGADFEMLDEGYAQLRNIEAKGTAAFALDAVDIRGQRNSKVTDLRDRYSEQIKKIEDGKLNLKGLAQGRDFMETFQSNNASDSGVEQEPFITISGDTF